MTWRAISAWPYPAAVLAGGLVLAATPAWEHLHVDDRVALQIAMASLPEGAVLRDVPVHLPRSSPDTAHRLVTGGALTVCPPLEMADGVS